MISRNIVDANGLDKAKVVKEKKKLKKCFHIGIEESVCYNMNGSIKVSYLENIKMLAEVLLSRIRK